MSSPYLGQICMFGFTFAPRGWAFCQGSIISIAQNTALFSLLNTYYGGDGRSTFGLPNLQHRVPFSQGTGPGLTPRYIGDIPGTILTELNLTQMPAHTHTANVSSLTLSGSTVSVDIQGSSETSNASIPDGAVNSPPQTGQKAYTNDPIDVTMQTAQGTATPSAVSGNVTIGNTGAGQQYSIMQPYLAVNFCICMDGLYPSRN